MARQQPSGRAAQENVHVVDEDTVEFMVTSTGVPKSTLKRTEVGKVAQSCSPGATPRHRCQTSACNSHMMPWNHKLIKLIPLLSEEGALEVGQEADDLYGTVSAGAAHCEEELHVGVILLQRRRRVDVEQEKRVHACMQLAQGLRCANNGRMHDDHLERRWGGLAGGSRPRRDRGSVLCLTRRQRLREIRACGLHAMRTWYQRLRAIP